MGAGASTFGFQKRDVSCHGARNGYAFICAFTTNVLPVDDTVHVSWRKGTTVIREARTFIRSNHDVDEIENLVPGDDYSVDILIDGVTKTIPFTIEEPPEMSLHIEKYPRFSYKHRGKVVAEAKNAKGDVRYTWKNMCNKVLGTGPCISNLTPARYMVEAQDDSGCTAYKTFRIV